MKRSERDRQFLLRLYETEGHTLLDRMNRDEPYADKLATLRHEMAHYDYSRRAGLRPEHLSLLAGYQQVKCGDEEDFAQAQLLCNKRAWEDLVKSAKGRMAFVKQCLAPVIVEELQGLSPKQIRNVTHSDNWDADYFLLKKWKLSPKDAEAIKNELRQQLRTEITPRKMKQYSHAARQIIKGHYGQRWQVSGFALERYLNGEIYDPAKTYTPPWALMTSPSLVSTCAENGGSYGLD